MSLPNTKAEHPTRAASLFEQNIAADILRAVREPIVISSTDCAILGLNPAAEKLFGYQKDELINQQLTLLLPSLNTQELSERLLDLNTLCALPNSRPATIALQNKSGQARLGALQVSQIRAPNETYYALNFYADTEQNQHNVQNSAPLGQARQNDVIAVIESLINSTRTTSQSLAVFIIDLSANSNGNSQLSLSISEQFKQSINEKLINSHYNPALFAPVGQDVFIMCLHVDNSTNNGQSLAQNLALIFNDSFEIEKRKIKIIPYIGVGVYNGSQQANAQQLLEEAYLACAQAKKSTEEVFQFFSNEISQQHAKEQQILLQIHKVIEQQKLHLSYQLQFDLNTLMPCGVEALPRLPNPEGGQYLPNEFLSVAKQYNLLADLEKVILKQACSDNIKLLKTGLLETSVALSVTTHFLSQPDTLNFIQATLQANELPGTLLELEINEDMAMNDYEQILDTCQELRSLGITLTMSDFGVGFSSIDRLKQLRFNKLKLGRSLIADLPGTAKDNALVRVMRRIAKDLGLESVANGIETTEQLEWLRKEGFQVGQGAWYSQPLPLEHLATWLEKNVMAVS